MINHSHKLLYLFIHIQLHRLQALTVYRVCDPVEVNLHIFHYLYRLGVEGKVVGSLQGLQERQFLQVLITELLTMATDS